MNYELRVTNYTYPAKTPTVWTDRGKKVIDCYVKGKNWFP